jgi:hypothetical protein
MSMLLSSFKSSTSDKIDINPSPSPLHTQLIWSCWTFHSPYKNIIAIDKSCNLQQRTVRLQRLTNYLRTTAALLYGCVTPMRYVTARFIIHKHTKHKKRLNSFNQSTSFTSISQSSDIVGDALHSTLFSKNNHRHHHTNAE